MIVRSLTLKGARIDAIHLASGARDIVIEDNDISEWGRYSHTNADGWQIGMNADAGIKGNANQPMTNTVSRNNIYHIRKSWLAAIDERGTGWGNDLDFDLFNGSVIAYPGAEPNGIVGEPIYETGHGSSAGADGLYQLAPHSAGYDRGVRLPNFNDDFAGAAPDIGAHEAGTPAMRFGVPLP